MRRIISFLSVALLLMGVTALYAAGGPSGPGTGDILGQGKFPQDPHKIFRLVRYVQHDNFSVGAVSSHAWLSKDALVVWDTRYSGAFGTCNDGVTVTATSTSYDSRVAGIIVVSALSQETLLNTSAQDVGKQNWTWLQTYGIATMRSAPNTYVLSGDAISTGGGAGYFGYGAVWGPNAGYVAAKYMGIAGVAIDDCAASDTACTVFIKGLD